MTSGEITEPIQAEQAPATSDSWLKRWDALLEWGSEYLNPILVKETRQALKSKQFAITFTLVLLAGWVWSLVAIIMRSPGIAYAPDGPVLLVGYIDILLFPLIIIIPYTAFRSLAAEREDGTYELLSISTLGPGHIIQGKLGSAVVQMLVYFSALAPCVAFTYLLRGIDVISIGLCLVFSFLLSLLLSVLGLLLATIANARHWQAVVSVGIILGLAIVYYWGLYVSYEFLFEDTSWRAYDNADFWTAWLAALTVYISYVLLIYHAATARITFPSENRVWKLRMVMLGQHFLFLLWWGYVYLNANHIGPLAGAIIVGCLHWGVMGALMVGESPVLSPRVRRTIPESLWGRVRLNWRLPGPARGYFLAVSGAISGGIVVASTTLFPRTLIQPYGPNHEGIFWMSILLPCYVICYLGLGRVIMAGVHRLGQGGIFVSLLIHVIVMAAACGLPWSFQLWYSNFRDHNYTLFQVANPFWTFEELFSGGSVNNSQVIPVTIILLGSAALMLLLQLYLSGRDLVPARSESVLPPRSPQAGAARPIEVPQSPWDE
ncbi:MAG: hypothetical protein WDZ51_10600 [Pirellulaceae bacterium]